jgi:two-component system, cell cycle response regulator
VVPSSLLIRRLLFTLLFAAVGLHLTVALTGGEGGLVDWLYTLVELGALGLAAWRAAGKSRDRLGWGLMALGLALWTAGDLCWTFWLNHVENPPFPSIADALYVGLYLAFYGGIAALLRNRIRPWPAWLVIDGVMSGLTFAALAAGVFFVPIRAAAEGSTAVIVTTLIYPVCDLLLLVLVLVAFAATGWRPGRSWTLLGAGLAVSALADSIYVYQEATGAYFAGSWLDSMWPLAFTVIALAAWQPRPPASPAHVGWSVSSVPLACSALSIGVLVHASLAQPGPLPVVLAGAALLAGMARAMLMLRENFALVRRSQREAMTDKLTELPNRRALMTDLDVACRRGRHSLVFFDLDGFKDYNDAFGHPAGDALLRRLAPALAAVGGRAYRLGGDEFCLLIGEALRDDAPLIEQAVNALSEQGDGFSVTASHGLVVVPDDAADATEALKLADSRMYARKRRRRGGARGQARDLLVRVMAEREPELDDHSTGVADLAMAVGRRLGLDAEALDVLVRAAELHDVGKVAVPDTILHKPGPLNDVEWDIMRQHTIVGERILAAADSLRPVARVVRASHERFDGRGYPDGLAGEAIPLEARIVCACDAYDAMISRRPYKQPMSPEEAIAELERCAGTQFDPQVVQTLTQLCQGAATLAPDGRADDPRGSGDDRLVGAHAALRGARRARRA